MAHSFPRSSRFLSKITIDFFCFRFNKYFVFSALSWSRKYTFREKSRNILLSKNFIRSHKIILAILYNTIKYTLISPKHTGWILAKMSISDIWICYEVLLPEGSFLTSRETVIYDCEFDFITYSGEVLAKFKRYFQYIERNGFKKFLDWDNKANAALQISFLKCHQIGFEIHCLSKLFTSLKDR